MSNKFREDEELDDYYHLVQRCSKRCYDLDKKQISGEIYKRKIRNNPQTNQKELEDYLSVSLFEYRGCLNKIKRDMKNRGVPLKDTDIFPQLQVCDFKYIGENHNVKNIVVKYKGGELRDSHTGIFNLPIDIEFCEELGELVSKKYFEKANN